jgi:hypothetical protein
MASTCALRAAGSPRAAALASVRHQRGSSRVVSPAAKGVSREGSRRRAASWRVEAAGAGTREAGVSAAEGLRRMTLQLAADGADGAARLKALVRRGKGLPALAAEAKTLDNRIVGCTTQVWLTARLDAAGHVIFQGTCCSFRYIRRYIRSAFAGPLCRSNSGADQRAKGMSLHRSHNHQRLSRARTAVHTMLACVHPGCPVAGAGGCVGDVRSYADVFGFGRVIGLDPLSGAEAGRVGFRSVGAPVGAHGGGGLWCGGLGGCSVWMFV